MSPVRFLVAPLKFWGIKLGLNGINNKLEELPKSEAQAPQSETIAQDLSSIKEAVVETTKAQSEDIKGLLAKHWKSYAQISTLILQHLDSIKKSQDKQGTQQEQHPQEHIHKHNFDIKSKKPFLSLRGSVWYASCLYGATLRSGNPSGSMPMTL